MSDHDDDEYDYDWPPICLRCGGDGTILFCPDDMCRGLGECMHGDGEMDCPDCQGEGVIL